MTLLSIISLTILALVLIAAFWPSNSPEMIETERTEAAILKDMDKADLTDDELSTLRSELAYARYVAKLTKTSVDASN